ncbi:MAG: 50S ribosomal protein L32 [Chloroflexi bacterium]|nr:50S ribosomal protein L32 [Chloroflexota bacterium]|tara:strand:+ start:539 stop:727 length:189 start_codon:yes stop_codon:yes gene_type:complete
MPPLPKKKHSKKRRGDKRAHKSINAIKTVKCSQCNSAYIPHRVCPECGYYNGKEIISSQADV